MEDKNKKTTGTKKNTVNSKGASKKTTAKVVKNETKKTPAKTTKKSTTNTTKKKTNNTGSKTVKKQFETKEVLASTKGLKEEKPIVLKKETKKEAVTETIISTKTWCITALCGLVLVIAIVIFSFANRTKPIDEDNYYVYATNNTLMLWLKDTNKKVQLSNTFVNDVSDEFDYTTEDLYRIENDTIYFIDNINNTTFDLNYVTADSKLTDGGYEIKRMATGISDYVVESKTVAYLKNSNLYIGEEVLVAESISEFDISENGKIVYYITKSGELNSYDIDSKKVTLIASNYEGQILTVDNDIYVFETSGYVYNLYKNGELFKTNITDYLEIQDEIIYYQYDDKYSEDFEKLTKEYDEKKITFNDIKEIISVNQRVLLYIGRPSCSYCSLLSSVFESIQSTTPFSYVYINTNLMDNDELEKLLDFANIESSEFGTPTLIVTQNSKLIDSNVGYLEQEECTEFLEKNGILSSKFTYSNDETIAFTPDMMFMLSDTYKLEDGEGKLFTKGLLYISSEENLFNSNYQINFVVDEDFDYNKNDVTSLYSNLILNTTKTSSGKTTSTGINYSSLQVLYLDNINDYLLYQTTDDEKVIQAAIKNGKLKTKEEYEDICSVTATYRGTSFLTACDSNTGIGTSSYLNGSKDEIIDENVYQTFAGNKDYIYYIKAEDSSYSLYSYKNKAEKISDVYYALQSGSEMFYYVQEVTVNEDEEGNETNSYTYKLYAITKDNESVLLTDNADFSFIVTPVKKG